MAGPESESNLDSTGFLSPFTSPLRSVLLSRPEQQLTIHVSLECRRFPAGEVKGEQSDEICCRSDDRGAAQAANGAISVFYVTLSSVQVGDIVLNNVPGTVTEGGARQQPVVLIGMSFLRHFAMQHAGNTLTLLRP